MTTTVHGTGPATGLTGTPRVAGRPFGKGGLVCPVAILVGFAVLSLAMAALADGRLRQFASEPRIATVALPPVAAGVAAPAAQTAGVLRLLRAQAGVASAVEVSPLELMRLVEPWLAPGQSLDSLRLPVLIDVTFTPGVVPDVAALRRAIGASVPGAVVDAAPVAGEGIVALVRPWRDIAAVAGLVLVIAAAGLAAWTTSAAARGRAELATKASIREIGQRALDGGVRGGLIGFAVAASLVAAGLAVGPELMGDAGFAWALRPIDWVLLACVPVVTALLIGGVAWLAANPIRGSRRPR